MSEQMKSVFDFERICKNCKHFSTGSDEPGQACFHPEHGNVFADFDETYADWETNQTHASLYLVDENGMILSFV